MRFAEAIAGKLAEKLENLLGLFARYSPVAGLFYELPGVCPEFVFVSPLSNNAPTRLSFTRWISLPRGGARRPPILEKVRAGRAAAEERRRERERRKKSAD